MTKQTLEERLLAYLDKRREFIASGELQRLADKAGYTGQTAGRILRRLAEDGVIDVEYRNPHNHAWYAAKESKKRVYEYVYDPERNCMVEVVKMV